MVARQVREKQRSAVVWVMISVAGVERAVEPRMMKLILLRNLLDYVRRGLALIVPVHAEARRPRPPGAYGPIHQYPDQFSCRPRLTRSSGTGSGSSKV